MNASGGTEEMAGRKRMHVRGAQGRQRPSHRPSRRAQVAASDAWPRQGTRHRPRQQDQEGPRAEMIYLLHVELDDNGTDLITCPAFPEVTTFSGTGDSAQAWLNGLGAIEEAIAARISEGDDIPAPATASQIANHKGLWVKLP